MGGELARQTSEFDLNPSWDTLVHPVCETFNVMPVIYVKWSSRLLYNRLIPSIFEWLLDISFFSPILYLINVCLVLHSSH